MPAFKDIGKAAKDLLTGSFQYDHKVSVGSKTDSGVTFTANGKKKGEGVSGDLKGAYQVAKGCTVEGTLTSGSKVDAVVKMDDLAPGLKCEVSASIPDKESGKLTLNYGKGCWGSTAEVGLRGAPKLDISAASKSGAYTMGGAISYDSAKSVLSKYDAGVQFAGSDFTVSAVTADKFDTVKIAYLHKVNSKMSVGAEIARKMSKGTTAFTLGAEQTLDGGAVGKATLNNAGLISMLYQQELRSKTVGAASVCFDTKNLDKQAKFGLELKVKP